MRPLPFDPTHLADTNTAAISVNTGNNSFTRTTGDFVKDGFVVGQKINY